MPATRATSRITVAALIRGLLQFHGGDVGLALRKVPAGCKLSWISEEVLDLPPLVANQPLG
jgi:hypothetical protein